MFAGHVYILKICNIGGSVSGYKVMNYTTMVSFEDLDNTFLSTLFDPTT